MESGRGSSQPIRLFIPAYGPIEAVLGYGFFYFLVDVGTPVVADAVVGVGIGIDRGAVTFAAAAALWVILVLSVLGQVTEQWRHNPHRFEDSAAARDYFEAIAPTPDRMQGWALLLVIGLVIVVFGFDAFIDSFRTLLDGMVFVVGSQTRVGTVFGSLPWFIIYTIGFSFVTRYTDRLLLGWLRRRRLERFGGQDE